MATAAQPSTIRLQKRITCPHCWEQFPPERVLWVSEHSDLLGDTRLGSDHQQRFLPTRFNIAGNAIDARGFPCHQLACPKCHLGVPRAMLEMEPLFMSVFGAPASGKSYYLAAKTWELRKVLGLRFHLNFADADPAMNQTVNEYEESLFGGEDTNDLVPLASLIRKTEEQGDLYDAVSHGSQTVSYPRPFVFNLQPREEHPNANQSHRLARAVCLYDNAGESFQPGKDTAASPVTRHMAHSRALFFVFDPTQDSRMRRLSGDRMRSSQFTRNVRQEPILQEAAARIRRYSGLRQGEKHNRPLIVVLTKCDTWSHLLSDGDPPDPWRYVSRGKVAGESHKKPMPALDLDIIERRSRLSRELMLQACPEIVAAAEGFAREVTYIPVSAIGWKAAPNDDGLLSIRPGDTEPYWVTIPFLYTLCRWLPGLVPAVARRGKN